MKGHDKLEEWRKIYPYVGPINKDHSWKLMEEHNLTDKEKPLQFHDIADKKRIEIIEEYRMLNALFNQKHYQDKLAAMTPQNQKHFRYIDTVAYENNRVTFPKGVKPNYINASWIHSEIKGKARIISTQGPLPDSIPNFWRMVFQERSPLIVMLCNLVENERVKCEKYWPDLEVALNIEELKIIGTSEKEFCKGVIQRNFKIIRGDEQHVTSQLHVSLWLNKKYTAWPDFGIPDKVGVQSFIDVVRHMYQLRKVEVEKPIIVHCSAGVGRTGTITAILELFQILNEQAGIKTKNKYFSIFGMVRRLREMRIMMVQSDVRPFLSQEQYQFIYEILNKRLYLSIKEQEKGKY